MSTLAKLPAIQDCLGHSLSSLSTPSGDIALGAKSGLCRYIPYRCRTFLILFSAIFLLLFFPALQGFPVCPEIRLVLRPWVGEICEQQKLKEDSNFLLSVIGCTGPVLSGEHFQPAVIIFES